MVGSRWPTAVAGATMRAHPAAASPALMACAAMRMVCSDDEQYRLTVTPGTLSSPERMATTRATLVPDSPAGWPQPMIRSSIVERSSSGTLSRAALTMCADRSSGRHSTSEPFIARPIATWLLAIAILLGGALGYRSLPVSALPEVDFPTIQVTTQLPGASPETVETLITASLERQLDFRLASDGGRSYSLTGTLEKPRVAATGPPETRAALKR